MGSVRSNRLLMLAAIIVVLLNAWLASLGLQTMLTAQHWLSHSLDVLTASEGTAEQLAIMNGASRGYLLLAQPTFAMRYNDANHKLDGNLDTLESLTIDNPSQKPRFDLLRQRLKVKRAGIEAAFEYRASHSLEEMPTSVLGPALGEGTDGGVTARYVLTQIESEEARLRVQRQDEFQTARQRLIVNVLLASALDLLLVVVAFELLRRAQISRDRIAADTLRIQRLNSDLTDINATLEARVAERTRELAVSNQELEAFSYSVSHDLRAPLRTIDGFSLALEEDFADKLNDEGRDYIRRVRSGVQRMGLLIDALLQLSRVTRTEPQLEPTDLSQLASLVFNELMVNDRSRDVVFEAEPEIKAAADPRLMRVAFENLIGNALKFTSKTPEARITFTCNQVDGESVYCLRDNGAGFDMQYVDRLFTAFQRLHGDRDFKGSGIGLATVSRIVRRQHGRIWAEGEIGKGAAFFWTLGAGEAQ